MRFYDHWRTDFELVEELGLQFLRYGPPIHRTWLGDGRHDWSFAYETFAALKARDILPIVDLCHFGVPDWIGNFQVEHVPFRGVSLLVQEMLSGRIPFGADQLSSAMPHIRSGALRAIAIRAPAR